MAAHAREAARMITERRAALVSTVVIVLLAAAGVFALWPRAAVSSTPTGGAGSSAGPVAGSTLGTAPSNATPSGATPSGATPSGATPSDAALSDADLAGPRAAAALAPCPASAQAAPAGGPLTGVAVSCLGAPGSLDLGRALAGRVTLVNVWASWCVPCQAELPVLARYASTPGSVPVLGVDANDDPGAALRLVTRLGVHLPAVSDPDGALGRALRSPPVKPLSYVVRADGSAVMVDPPVPFASSAEVAAAVARLS